VFSARGVVDLEDLEETARGGGDSGGEVRTSTCWKEIMRESVSGYLGRLIRVVGYRDRIERSSIDKLLASQDGCEVSTA